MTCSAFQASRPLCPCCHAEVEWVELLSGRDEDLAWLRITPGDLLVVGQPGSGKTYLRQVLAGEGRCLFAVDRDLGRLADAIRAQEPSIIVLDDVHTEIELLESIMRMRHEPGIQFSLHANCWLGSERPVTAKMNLPKNCIRILDRLPRTTILKLIKDSGILGPDPLGASPTSSSGMGK